MSKLAVVTLPSVTGLAKDNYVNTWAIAEHVDNVTSDAKEASILSALADFYVGMGGIFSSAVSRAANACTLKLYDITGHLDGTPHGSPIQLGAFGMPAPAAGIDFPSEVAIAVTLEGTHRADSAVEVGTPPVRPKQRHTGRVYLGPLRDTISDHGSPCRPAAASMTSIRTAVDTLDNALRAIGTIGLLPMYSLGVWSRKNATIYPLANVSTDNAFDTQRRRGEASTARTRTVVEVTLAA